ncbi:MAG: ester cyclase [Acidobacteriota bacterium]
MMNPASSPSRKPGSPRRGIHCAATLLGLSLLAGAAGAVAGEAENLQLVRQMAAAINERDFDALDDLVALDVVRHSAATPDVRVTNLAEFKEFLQADLKTCPDAMQEIEMIFGSGDLVALRARYAGTQTGPLGPFPPSGKRMDIPFIGILRIRDGKIAEIWVEWDNLNALTQLGHFTPPDRKP